MLFKKIYITIRPKILKIKYLVLLNAVKKEIPVITNLVTNASLNAKINKVKNEISTTTTNLATNTALTAVENKMLVI